ncbi:MAG TPA: endolytic transglycosylase MltG [Actinomycetota bacterium]
MLTRTERRVHHRRRRRGLAIFLSFTLLTAAILFGAFQLANRNRPPPVRPGQPVTVTVVSGEDTREVADSLEGLGVIDNAGRFRRLAEQRGLDAALRPGSYRLTTGMSQEQVLDILVKGPNTRSLTIPEGFTQRQIADRLATVGHFDRAEVLRALHDPRLESPYRPSGKPLEGLLFPLTYQIGQDDTPTTVVQAMLDQLQLVLSKYDLAAARPAGVRLTPYQILTVASLIEAEAKVPGDRPKIAAVIYNRLKRDIPLQIDPTVQYAWALRGHPKPRLGLADLRIGSPYNTYRLRGLPPTPIDSPGEQSIRAALQPASADWLYYVVVGRDGHHAFTASYQQFLELKRKAKSLGVA